MWHQLDNTTHQLFLLSLAAYKIYQYTHKKGKKKKNSGNDLKKRMGQSNLIHRWLTIKFQLLQMLFHGDHRQMHSKIKSYEWTTNSPFSFVCHLIFYFSTFFHTNNLENTIVVSTQRHFSLFFERTRQTVKEMQIIPWKIDNFPPFLFVGTPLSW